LPAISSNPLSGANFLNLSFLIMAERLDRKAAQVIRAPLISKPICRGVFATEGNRTGLDRLLISSMIRDVSFAPIAAGLVEQQDLDVLLPDSFATGVSTEGMSTPMSSRNRLAVARIARLLRPEPAAAGLFPVEKQIVVHTLLAHQRQILEHRLDAVLACVPHRTELNLLAVEIDATTVRPVLASKEAPSVRSPGWSESIVALSFVMWCIRSSDATARPSSWWSLLPLPHGVQRNTVGTRWSRGRCWKGMNRGRKNLSIRSGRRSFAVRGDGSCKGETRHSVIDMNVRRMKGKILPACRFYGEGNC